MRLMIVGHLEGYISTAGKIALQRGAKVIHCEDIEQALGALRNGKGADVVMVDVKQKIEKFITALETERFSVPVVACGIGTDTTSAVNAIKAGAKEYVPLPPDADLIAAILEAVTEDNSAMIASDPAMQRILKLADQVAPSEATILITGESGTGKEVMSRYIHEKSKRKNGPFIALNCAAIPENLLESELFGHEKGAFTGAIAKRIGKFEEATGGTLLLDEVSEMHPSLQAKLLRAIQERVIDRVGGKAPVRIDVRIIATSNRNLQDSVNKGEFREDLYFRLNVVNLALPALRERPADIVPLAQFFADKYAEVNGVLKKKLSPEAQEKIRNSKWRGNVRELENAMHRAVLIAAEDQIEAGAIHLSDVPEGPSAAPAPQASPGAQGGQTLADMEKTMILNTLEDCLGNRTHAAKILGISIRTLRNKLNQYADEGVKIPASM